MVYKRRGKYLYRSRRIGRRVVTEYLGAGELAELEAELAAQRAADRETERREWDRDLQADVQLDEYGQALRILTRATLLASGYHQHKGQWRRQRDDGNSEGGRAGHDD